MFKNLNLGTKLIIGFLAVALIVLVVGVMGYVSTGRINHNLEMTDSLIPQLDAISEMHLAVSADETEIMEMVAAGNMQELEKAWAAHEQAVEDFDKYMQALKKGDDIDGIKYTVADAGALKLLDEADAMHDGQLQPALVEIHDVMKRDIALQEKINKGRGGKKAEAEMAKIDEEIETHEAEADETVAAFNAKLGEVEDDIWKDINESREDSERTATSSRIMMIAGMILGTVLGLALGLLITRSITGPVNRVIAGMSEGSSQVASAAGQMSTASQQLAEGASEQASSLEEISSSLEEMASMTRQNANNAEQANALAKEANNAAQTGNESTGRMLSAMDKISKSADETSKIIKTIDEIAFQTNLLALNAAVEAARAGEAGKGFAVVAEEVRNLAQRAGEAARNTTDLIEGSVSNTKNGAEIADELAKALAGISESSSKVTDLIAEIAAASKEQAQGIDQVNQSVGLMDQVVQKNASNAEESASAAEEMNSQSESLNGMVAELVAVVGGTTMNGSGSSAGSVSRHHLDFSQHKPMNAPKASGNGNHNGHKSMAVASGTNAETRQTPEEVIPLEDDFKEF